MSGLTGQAVRAAFVIAFLGVTVWLLGATFVGTASVSGRSMAPTLEPGDRVLVDRWTYERRPPRPGEVVLVEAPDRRLMIKRVARPPGSLAPAPAPRVWLLGDNPGESEDSRLFGPVDRRRIRGRVVWRYWPPARFGATGLRLPGRYPSRSRATNR